MRILHVISTLNIGSGIANFVMSYYRKMVCKDVQFDFLLFNPVEKDFTEEVKALGGRVYFIPQPTLNFGKYSKAVKRFFKEHNGEWDIVHIHEILVQKFISKSCRKYGGVKKVAIHSHASEFVLPTFGVSAFKNKMIMAFKRVRNSWLLSGIKRNCDYFFACSVDAGIALYGKKILRDKRFCVINNAIDTQKYAFDEKIRKQYRKELNIEDKKVIIQVGRLCEQKNQTFFLDAMQKICESDSSYVLLLVGDGRLKKDVKEKTARLNLGNNVILTGNRTDVENLFQCADISVLPSLTEGLGIVLIEAQASGLPCVASTGVPKEAEITPYVRFLDLKDGAERWAEAVLNTGLVRYDTKDYVINNGYDIDTNVEKLYNKYNSFVGN